MDADEYKRLKETYKAHYKKINELKKKLAEVRRVEKINSALEQMRPDELMGSFDQLVRNLKEKISIAEAKISMAMDHLNLQDESSTDEKNALDFEKNEEFIRQQKAKETLNMLKNEMGMLHEEVEKEAKSLKANKTIGNEDSRKSGQDENQTKTNQRLNRVKTLGPREEAKEGKND